MIRIINSQEEYAIAPDGYRQNELAIVQCITRSDDFMIGMHQENILDSSLSLPIPGEVLFWPMLSRRSRVRRTIVVFDPAAITDENSIGKAFAPPRLLRSGAAALSSPFIFLLRVSLYVFRYVDDWRRRPGTLAARCWDPAARWKLRRYCELDHTFETRLRRAHRPTTQYVRMFTNELSSIVARFALVICGGFVLVSLALTLFVDEGYLLAELAPGYLRHTLSAAVVRALASSFHRTRTGFSNLGPASSGRPSSCSTTRPGGAAKRGRRRCTRRWAACSPSNSACSQKRPWP